MGIATNNGLIESSLVMDVCPPIGKEKRYENLTLTVIHATECGTPERRDPI